MAQLARRIAALVFSLALPSLAIAADRYVAPFGADAGNDCSIATAPCRSINHAIGQSASGDTIDLAAGNYREGVRIQVEDAALTLTVLGGWNAEFTSRDPAGTPSVIRSAPSTIEPFVGKDRTWIIHADDGAVVDVTMDGLVLTRGRATITPPSLPANFRYRTGGGLLAFAYEHSAITLAVSNTTITRNAAIDQAGGALLYTHSGGTIDATFTNVLVTRNRSKSGIGGFYAIVSQIVADPSSMHVRLIDSAIVQNAGRGAGGGAAFEAAGPDGSSLTVDLLGTTVAKNVIRTPNVLTPGSFDSGGSGIFAGGYTPLILNITNSIVWGNRATGLGDVDVFVHENPSDFDNVTFNVDHSDIGDVGIGASTWNDLGGNVNVDPKFTKAPHLRVDSPLIDAGTCTGLPATDIDGDTRPSGATCDIGADEVAP